MLASKNKVSRDLFTVLAAKGRTYPSEHFSFRIARTTEGEDARCSVVVSKKIEKNAVDRNRAKRRLYALMRAFLPRVESGTLCVFFLKKKISACSLSVLKGEVEELLKKSGILSVIPAEAGIQKTLQ